MLGPDEGAIDSLMAALESPHEEMLILPVPYALHLLVLLRS